MRNVTLSAEESLIDQARRRASAEHTTLNALFREWLRRYVGQASAPSGYRDLMASLAHVRSGGPFDRDEMNER